MNIKFTDDDDVRVGRCQWLKIPTDSITLVLFVALCTGKKCLEKTTSYDTAITPDRRFSR
jgi:hypothetical protein